MAEVGCLKDSHVQNLEVNQQSLITGNQIIEGEQTIKGSLKFTDGGAIEQLISKSTGVTLNSRSGKITTHNASLAANGVVSFTVTNSKITTEDVVVANHVSGGTLGAYVININTFTSSGFNVTITNISAGALTDALVIHFVAFTATIA